MKDNIWGLLAGIFLVAILYMLVRPGSPAVTAITSISSALENIISMATNGVSAAAGNTPTKS
jgi:hypothetical protein